MKNKIQRELSALKEDKNMAIMPVMLIIIITFLLLFGSEDLSAKEPIEFGSFLTSRLRGDRWQIIDIGKLADCVAIHETHYCTAPGSPTANSRNNCWGLRPGGKLASYASIEDGKSDFIRRWVTYYGNRYPTPLDAQVYSGMDNWEAWYKNVNNCLSK